MITLEAYDYNGQDNLKLVLCGSNSQFPPAFCLSEEFQLIRCVFRCDLANPSYDQLAPLVAVLLYSISDGWSQRMIRNDRQMVQPITCQLICACSFSNSFLAAYLQIALHNKTSGLCKTRRIDFSEWRAFLVLNVLVCFCFKSNRSAVRGGWRWTPTVGPGRWPLTSRATPPVRPRDCPLPEAQVHRDQRYCWMWIQV